MNIPRDDIQAAIHKAAAAKMSQGSAVAPQPSAIKEDLSVLASQAAEYSRGQAAGNAQAEQERGQVTEGLAQERATADQARAEELEAQRRKMAEIELAKRAAEQEAAQEAAAIRQRTQIELAQAAESALQARMEREDQMRRQAAEQEALAEEARIDGQLRRIARTQSPEFQADFASIASTAANPAEAAEALATLQRASKGNLLPSGLDMRSKTLRSELERFYGSKLPKPASRRITGLSNFFRR